MDNNCPVVMAEDDRLDQMSARRAFKELNISNPLIIAENGRHAIEILENTAQHSCLILLDLNMPQMNGIEFLKFRQKNEKLKMIPTVVLTTSEDDKDVAEAYKHCIA